MILVTPSARESLTKPVGLSDGRIKDSQITASDSDAQGPAKDARLNRPGGWQVTPTTSRYWIMVTFEELVAISGIATQGREDTGRWITRYSMKMVYGSSSTTFVSRVFNRSVP